MDVSEWVEKSELRESEEYVYSERICVCPLHEVVVYNCCTPVCVVRVGHIGSGATIEEGK